MNFKHGEVNYYLTQMLSNHGCFRAYLHRFKHEEAPQCPAGCGEPEDAEHVFFWCQRFTDDTKELKDTLGSTPDPETLVKLMLTTEEKWSAVSGFATKVMTMGRNILLILFFFKLKIFIPSKVTRV